MSGLCIGKIFCNKFDRIIIILFVILAAGDLFRAYADQNLINAIFALKELIIISAFILLFIINKYKLSYFEIGYIILLLIYSIVNSRDEYGVLLHLVFIKYIFVYIFSFYIFNHLNLNTLTVGCNLLVNIFWIYSVFSIIQGLFSPDSLVRSGRISGFANPSFLSQIYLYCFIYNISQDKIFKGLWFIVAGFLTMTKTFFVAAPIIVIISIVYSKQRTKIIGLILFAIPLVLGVVENNKEMFITFDRAYKVLIERDQTEYNSMDDRVNRIEPFINSNSGSFIIGYGTGKASSASVFLLEKLGVSANNTIDFENQYLNFYYSWGVLGIILIFWPIINLTYAVYHLKGGKDDKRSYNLYLITFLLFGITLNIIEAFTSCIVSLIFLFYAKQKIKNSHRLSHVNV